MAKQYVHSVRTGDPSSMDPATPANAQAWLAQAQVGHIAAGCTGRGRGFADVQRTLVEVGARMEIGVWPVDLWRVTSGVAHHLLPHRVAQQVDGDIVCARRCRRLSG